MGTWGSGNFQDDDALDYLATEVIGPLASKMESVLNDPTLAEPDEPSSKEILAAVEILSLLCENLGAVPPAPDIVAACHAEYLRIWDDHIDLLLPKEDYKRERRAAITSSFERLESVSRSWYRRSV